MPKLSVKLMGRMQCQGPCGSPITLPTRKTAALLALLAMNPGREQSRERLAALLWEDKDEPQARANLRKTLSRLHSALPEEASSCLAVDSVRIVLSVDDVRVDVPLFAQLARTSTPRALEQAASLYEPGLLDGLEGCGEAFEEWRTLECRRIEEIGRQTLKRLLDHYVITGSVDRAIHVALRLLAMDALQEDVHRTLIRLYMYQERMGSAARQYAECCAALEKDLGVKPAPETENLYAEVLRKTPQAVLTRLASKDDAPLEYDDPVAPSITEKSRRRREVGGAPSIALLPFVVVSEDESDTYLGDGLAEDLITELGRFSQLDVIARATVGAFRFASVSPEDVGQELDTRYVLSGTVRRRSNALKVTAQLMETASGTLLWAERYNCARDELFELNQELIRQLVVQLVGGIESAELRSTRRKPTEHWQAYDYWLRGWHVLRHRAGADAIREARALFQKSIEVDAEFARAYVGLAASNLTESHCYAWRHWVFLRAEALNYARKAVELDPNDHQALCMLGMSELYMGDASGTYQRLMKAWKLNPNDTDVLANVSFAFALLGEHEASVDAGRTALRLAPYCPEWYLGFVGIALFAARRYGEAIETMAPAPEALCDTAAFIAASHAYLGQSEHTRPYREAVNRHYRIQRARGEAGDGTTCLEWLLSLNPFYKPVDAEHFAVGLQRAGFE